MELEKSLNLSNYLTYRMAQNKITTKLSISLSRDEVYEVIPAEENVRPKLQRSITVQVSVKPIRSKVILSRPSSIYDIIDDDEEDYVNIFQGDEYANLDSPERIDLIPTPPPRDLPHTYSIIHDGYSFDSPSLDDLSNVCIMNDTSLSFNNLPLVKHFDNLILEIHNKFNVVRNELKNREECLISTVEEARKKYQENVHKHKRNITKINSKICKLEASKTINEQSIQKINELNFTKYNCIQTGAEETNYSFHVSDNLNEMIRNFGELHIENIPEYSKMCVTSRQYVGKAGKNANEIDFPMGLAVDYDTNNVYVVDQGEPKVCVVSPDGKVQVFGKTNGILKQPHGICFKNGKVYVTDNNKESKIGEVFVYNTKGKLLGKCVKEGGMSQALGISVDCSENIYVCDGISNSIHVFDSKFNHKQELSMSVNAHPLDIKVTESALYILVEERMNKLNVLVFDNEHQLIGGVLDKNMQKDFGNIQFFTIDNCGNIVLADQTTHCLHVVGRYGNLITNIIERDKMGYFMPNGVDINRNNKIVTSWLRNDTALRIF